MGLAAVSRNTGYASRFPVERLEATKPQIGHRVDVHLNELRLRGHEPRHRPQLGVRNHALACRVVLGRIRVAAAGWDVFEDVGRRHYPTVGVDDDERAHRGEHLAVCAPSQTDKRVRELARDVDRVSEHAGSSVACEGVASS